MRRSVAGLPAIIVLALALGGVAPAGASAPGDDVDFGPWCMAGRTEIAAIVANFVIRDFESDQLDGFVPMLPSDDSPLRQIVFEMDIEHTWVGDLVIRLEYANCQTGETLYGTNILCRPRGTEDADNVPCGAATQFGCSGNLGKSKYDQPPLATQRYYFADESTNILDNGACADVLGPGCFQPSVGGTLAGFEGLPRGGCWRLIVSDWKLGDVGSIAGWGVWELKPLATPTVPRSWGRLKTIYR